MVDRPHGICRGPRGGPNGCSVSANVAGRDNGWQHLRAGAPVVLRKVDLNPRITAAFNNVQRSKTAEGVEGARQPVVNGAAGDQPLDLCGENGRAAAAE